MSDVLSTCLYLPFGLRDADRETVLAALVQDLICYDTVWILSDQMAALGPLLEEMGPGVLKRVLDDGTLRFVHDRQILSWPLRRGYSGPVPVFPLVSMGTDGGFTQVDTKDIAFHLALEMDVPLREARGLSRSVEKATQDFGGIPKPNDPSAPTLAEGAVQQLQTYSDVVSTRPDGLLTEKDLRRLIIDLRNPRRSPLKTKDHRVARITTEPGWAALASGKVIPGKQYELLSYFLADRSLAILAETGLAATLHSDPAVERVFRARLDGVRQAASGELDQLLHASEVRLPSVSATGSLEFEALLDVRNSVAGQEFRRSVVGVRDGDADVDLLQAYHRALRDRVGDRVSIKAARFLVSSIAGLIPGLGAAVSALDSFLLDCFLAKREPDFFIDDSLRRLSSGEVED